LRTYISAVAASLALACLVISPVGAVESSPAPSPLACVQNERSGTLANGLRYVLRCLPDAPEIRLQLIVRAGTLQGGLGNFHLAHLAEHVVVENAKTPTGEGSFFSRIAAWGLVPGQDSNATTGDSSTSFWLRLPKGQARYLSDAVNILSDWAAGGRVQNLERDRNAVLSEISGTINDPTIEYALLGRDTPYWSNFEENRAFLDRVTSAQIDSFISRWYRPNAEAIFIAGNVDVVALERDVRARFSNLSGRAPATPSAPRVSLRVEKRVLVMGADLPERRLELIFKRPVKTGNLSERAQFQATHTVLEALLRARLQRLAEHSDSSLSTLRVSPLSELRGGIATFRIGATVNPNDWTRAAFDIAQSLSTARQHGFSEDELSAARAELNNRPRRTGDGVSDSMAGDVAAFLGLPTTVPPDAVEYDAVSMSAVRKLMDELLVNRDLILVAQNPSSAPGEVPVEGKLEEAFVRGWSKPADAMPPIDRAIFPEPLRPLANAGAQVLNKERVGVAEAIRFEGGPLVVFLPESVFEGRVALLGLNRAGAIAGTEDDQFAARWAVDAVAFGPVGGLDRFSRARSYSENQIAIEPFINFDTSGVRATGPSANLELLLQRVRDVMSAGDFDPALFEHWREARLDQIALGGLSPDSSFEQRVWNDTYGAADDDPTFLKRVKPAQLSDAYQRRFRTPDQFVFILSGNFQPAQAKTLMGRFFASLPKGQMPDLPVPNSQEWPPRSRETLRAGDQRTAQIFVRLRAPLPATDLGPAITLLSRALDQRLSERLREKEQGTYSATGQIVENKGNLIVGADFRTSEANIERMVAAAESEILSLAEEAAAGKLEVRQSVSELEPTKDIDTWTLGRALLANGGDLKRAFAPPMPIQSQMLKRVGEAIMAARLKTFILVPQGGQHRDPQTAKPKSSE